MKLSYQWLKEWVAFDASPASLAEQLTRGGLEVDAIEHLGEGLEGVVVAEIEHAEPHPNADRLRVCQVKGDSEPRTIVCGAPNARAGLKAPLATLGATLPNGMTIKRAKLRGVGSEGMLCAASELGLADDEAGSAGLMELAADAPIGEPLTAYLNLDDAVLDVDLTPNRADCLSIQGMAREVAALLNGRFSPPSFDEAKVVSEATVPVSVNAPEDCPVYLARVISKVDVNQASPLWMQERLRRAGVRPISVVVDVTNYVMLELGQPMHAFDANALAGGIEVRRAQPGEALTLLDGQTIELDQDCLVIADDAHAVALAGVMGGADSAVGEGTDTIVLESAWFDPAVVAGRARRFGLHTESSHRFERGVDPTLQAGALERATALIVEIAGGEPGPAIEACAPDHRPGTATVELTVGHVNRVLGTALTVEAVQMALEALAMTCQQRGDDVLHVEPPPARRDIATAVDLIEEVARMVGYDALPAKPPSGALKLKSPPEDQVPLQALRQSLMGRGFQEVLGWSFVAADRAAPNGEPIAGLALANPLSQDQGKLRASLLPSLLDIAQRNRARGRQDMRLFEMGHVYHPDKESNRLGLLMMGQATPEHYDQPGRALDFFDLKGELEQMLLRHGLGEVTFQPEPDSAWLHPGQSAQIVQSGCPIGWLGRLHPHAAEALDLKANTLVAELELADWCQGTKPQHRPVSRYPASRRDLALLVPDTVPAGAVLDEASRAGGEVLERVVLFDLYQGDGVEKGFKSLGIGLIIRDNSRTLTDDDVDALTQGVLSRLSDAFEARLRG